MSWKPGRGNRILLNKHTDRCHRLYFEFQEETDKMKKSKIAYQWYLSERYFNSIPTFINHIINFINECKKDNQRVYKPFLKLIETI